MKMVVTVQKTVLFGEISRCSFRHVQLVIKGSSEQADHEVEIVNMKVEGDKPAFVLVEHPAACIPMRHGRKPLKTGGKDIPVRFFLHNPLQILTLLRILQHLCDVNEPIFLACELKKGSRFSRIQGKRLLTDDRAILIQRLPDMRRVQKSRRTDVNQIRERLVRHLRNRIEVR